MRVTPGRIFSTKIRIHQAEAGKPGSIPALQLSITPLLKVLKASPIKPVFRLFFTETLSAGSGGGL